MDELGFANLVDGLKNYAIEKHCTLGKDGEKEIQEVIKTLNSINCFYNNNEELAPWDFVEDTIKVIQQIL